MPTTSSHYARFSLPGSAPLGRRQINRLFKSKTSGTSRAWNALKFIAFLPIILAMLIVSLIAGLAFMALSVLMVPVVIFGPMLGIAALILIAGFFLELLGVGT